MPRVFQEDVARALSRRGWLKRSGGDMYFPPHGYPHLHARLYGTGDRDRILDCIRYLGVTRSGAGQNTDLVRNGQAVGGGLASLGRGEIKTEADYVLNHMRLPS